MNKVKFNYKSKIECTISQPWWCILGPVMLRKESKFKEWNT